MRLTATGPTPPDDVWQRYVHPQLWPTWAPQIRRVVCDDETITAGTRGVVHGPWPVRVPFRVLSVDATERRWSWEVLGLTMTHGVDRVDGGSRAWVSLATPIAIPYAPVAQFALQRLVR